MNPYDLKLPARPSQPKTVPITPTELMQEISWSESDLLRSFAAYGQNPDPVARAKGLYIYREMMEDDQVKACTDLRKQARLSTPWEIISAEDGDEESDRLAEFVKHVLKRMQGTFEDDLYEIYSAIEYGFSISELIYAVLEDGPFAGKIGLRAIKTREPFNYDFKVDDRGNLLGLIYTGLAPAEAERFAPRSSGLILPQQTANGKHGGRLGTMENPLPPEKFVIYSYNMQFGNWYGRSDLFAAFRSWLIKKHIMKFWSIWLERYASPFIWAQYKRDAGLKKAALDELDSFLRLIGTRNAIRVSDAVELNPVQFSTAGGDAYEKAIEAHNRFISHAILTPNLMGFTGSQGSGGTGGTYALGKKHFDAFVWVLEKMGRDTAETIVGEQIIKRLVSLNFPNVDFDKMPKFKFEGVEEESIETRARIITLGVQNGFINSEEEWVRDFLTLPAKSEDVVLVNPKEEQPIVGEEEGKEKEEKTPAKENSRIAQVPLPATPLPKKMQERREPTRFERKMRPREFARALDTAQEAFEIDLEAELSEIRDSVVEQVERKGIVESGDPKAVERVVINVSGVKDVLRKWLMKIHLDSKLRALEELGRAGIEVEIMRSFKAFAREEAPFEPWDPLPPREAIDFFNRKVKARITNRDGEKVLIILGTHKEIPYYDEKAFAISGVVRDDLLNDAKQVLLNGIKRQDRISAIVDLKNLFNRYVQQGIEVDGELLEPSRLQTIVRTNMVEAVNEGRRAMYEDPEVPELEFFQYTAILDARTTDYCRCMDGKVFRLKQIGQLNPPAHFNCRSFTVPITQFEVDEMRGEGKGVELAQPCPDRAAGFSDWKREPVATLPDIPKKEPVRPAQEPVKETPLPSSQADLEATERLKKELALLIVRCPYTTCRSQDIVFKSRRMNVGEYDCHACGLPFRVSNTGDLYLYDAGTDSWQRVSMGAFPRNFEERK